MAFAIMTVRFVAMYALPVPYSLYLWRRKTTHKWVKYISYLKTVLYIMMKQVVEHVQNIVPLRQFIWFHTKAILPYPKQINQFVLAAVVASMCVRQFLTN